MRLTSGGFTHRDSLTQKFIQSVSATILTSERYYKIETGIEYRFGEKAKEVHGWLYNSLGPTTDLLRYFPDSLYFDLRRYFPDWGDKKTPGEFPQGNEMIGCFTFFVEYKYSRNMRRKPLPNHPDVPLEYIGIIEREAWLTYRRLTTPNPPLDTYLDGKRPRIALFYAAEYAPEKLYAAWEENIEPIHVVTSVARPNVRSLPTRGSGTPWVNFDIRQMKPMEKFLVEDLFWDVQEADQSVLQCKNHLFG
ncbi:hypothetical protein D6779_05330 [Candidatus Parcubacteria bacterium]|nr:MAG: hypothetical protein D6779_05330 [Candidatus Parcubacteria bacterium]